MIADELEFIKSQLANWAQQDGGTAFIASDPSHMWKMAYAAADKPRVIICYMGEDVRGGFQTGAFTHRVDRKYNVVVTRGRGFNAERGDSLTQERGNARPLFNLFEEARDIIRSIVGLSQELPIDYLGAHNFSAGEIIMDAYVIDFSIAVDLPNLGDQPDNPAPPIV